MALNYGKSSEWTLGTDVEGNGCGLFWDNLNICLESYKNHKNSQNRWSMRLDLNLGPPKNEINFGLSPALRNRLQGAVYEAHL